MLAWTVNLCVVDRVYVGQIEQWAEESPAGPVCWTYPEDFTESGERQPKVRTTIHHNTQAIVPYRNYMWTFLCEFHMKKEF